MRLHEVLEACVEYVAMDGVLGSEPRVLQQYLRTLDPGIDEDFFAHVWQSLIRHPLLQFIITAYPISDHEGTTHLGTAPLPPDYNTNGESAAPVSDIVLRDGEVLALKGRALAFALEGKEYKTDKQTVAENRKAKRVKAQDVKVQRNKAGSIKPKGQRVKGEVPEPEMIALEDAGDRQATFKVIEEDDGGIGEDRIARHELSRLNAKWGSRLRIRATDDEIYFRLTGSHQRIGKITPIVFHALQLSARSRERGITALELGPAVGSSQGSIHHYMKTLCQLGLCTKVPIVMHSSITNLLLFHRFMHLNNSYRALKKLPSLEQASLPSHVPDTHAPQSLELSSHQPVIDEEQREDDDDDDEETRPEFGWDMNFGPITEEQLMAGHVVKERLLQILDHPGLKNHLLKRKNLLPLIGWHGKYVLRHRRAIPRVLDTLVHDGVVEVIEVGEKQVRCIRLTKFNPEFVTPVHNIVKEEEREDGPHLLDDESLIREHVLPYDHHSTAQLTEHLDYQVVHLVQLSGATGLTISEIRDTLDHYYKRNIEAQYKRAEDGYVPPHLRQRQIVHSMDTQGKERRLKALSLPAYRRYMEENNLAVDDAKYPPITDEIGHWGSLTHKTFWQTDEQVHALLVRASSGDARALGGQIKATSKGVKRKRKGDELEGEIGEQTPEPKVPIKQTKYAISSQARGRPRRYIHVVNVDGKVERKIIGNIYPTPELSPIWVYVAADKMLYPAEEGYNGLGQPPPISAEARANGKTPAFFKKLPGNNYDNKKTKTRTAKSKTADDHAEPPGSEQLDDSNEAENGEANGVEASDCGSLCQASETQVMERKEPFAPGLPTEPPKSAMEDVPHSRVHVEHERSTGEPEGNIAAPLVEGTGSSAHAEALYDPQPAKREDDSLISSDVDNTMLFPDTAAGSATPILSSEIQDETAVPTDAVKSCAANQVLDSTKDSDHLTGNPLIATSDKRPRSPTPPPASVTGGTIVSLPKKRTRKLAPAPGSIPTTDAVSPQIDEVTGSSDAIAIPSERLEPRDRPKRHEADLSALRSVDSPTKVVKSHSHNVPTETVQGERADVGTTIHTLPIAQVGDPSSSLDESVTRVDIVDDEPSGQLPITGIRSRIDMGNIRRMNELVHALREEAGGICERHRMVHVQIAYAKRVAGTDAPGANPVATQMDRVVVTRLLNQLAAEGRLKFSTLAVWTTTGKAKDIEVVYLPETDQSTIRNFGRLLSERLANMYIVKRPTKTQIPATEYTEIRVPVVPAKDRRAALLDRRDSTTLASNKHTSHADVANVTPEIRRATLLGDLRVIHCLYGYRSGKNARLQTMHNAIVNAFSGTQKAKSIVSTAPRIFSLDMLFTEITAREWFYCISYIRYSERLEQFIRDPANKNVKIRDVPSAVRPRGCFKGHGAKQKLLSLLTDLCELKIMAPLVTVDPDSAEIVCEDDERGLMGFNKTNNVTSAIYFRLYDLAPVYHIAADALGLLGMLPVRDQDEVSKFWSTAKTACLEVDPNSIPKIDRQVTDHSLHAPLQDHLEFENVETVKLLRTKHRWKMTSRLVDVQSKAIESLFDKADGSLLPVDEEKLKSFAWEWAIPYDFLKSHIEDRLKGVRVKEKAKMLREREVQAKQAALARRRQAEFEFETKLKEMKAAGKLEFEQRVRAAAKEANIPYSPALESFLISLSLQSLRVGPLTDDQLVMGCRMFIRYQSHGSLAPPEEYQPVSRLKFNPLSRKSSSRKPMRPNTIASKVKRNDARPSTRRRLKWTDQEDARLIYAEAIIRARYKGNGMAKRTGRAAIFKIFPDVTNQVLLHRLKKLWEMPGKKAFYERLIDIFLDLWIANRGTEALPDDDPTDVANFDIASHIAFLMAQVPPIALSNSANDMVPNEVKIEDLPESPDEILSSKAWDYASVPVLTWDAIWELNHDELRNTTTASIPLLDEPLPPSCIGSDVREKGKLRSLLKTITGTDVSDYQEDVALSLIEDSNQAHLRSVAKDLIDEKVIRKWRGASGGRLYIMNQSWINAGDGIFPEELLGEADGLRDRLQTEEGEPKDYAWPLTGPEGEIASLMNMVSNHEIDFNFEPEDFPTLKHHGEGYHTRCLNDVDFEFPVTVRCKGPQEEKKPIPDAVSISQPSKPRKWAFEGAATETSIEGAVKAVLEAGSDGITRSMLQVHVTLNDSSMVPVLAGLHKARVFWAGYDTARLVHLDYWKEWTAFYRDGVRDSTNQVVELSLFPGRNVLPRIWTDIFGHMVPDLWERAKRNVLGYIIGRPGASERYLRNHIGNTLDRLEVNEVLQWLLDAQLVERQSVNRNFLPPVEAVDVDEEEDITWYPLSTGLWH